jgi:purine-binding chemotaxis protein CheW
MATKGNIHNYLSFRVGYEWYGVSVNEVIEVLHLVALNEVPASNIMGLMTLRDQIMPVVNLRQLFRLPEEPLRLDTPIIAIRTPQGGLGLVADETDDVREILDDQIQAYSSSYVNRVARSEQRLLLLLDVSQLEQVATYR